KKPDENVGFDPVAVSLEHGVPFAKKGGQIAPRAPRPDHPQHCFNEQPIVLAASTRVRRLAQTMRLHLRPLGVSQNESFHPKLESQTSFPWNPESQQTLIHLRSNRRTRIRNPASRQETGSGSHSQREMGRYWDKGPESNQCSSVSAAGATAWRRCECRWQQDAFEF